MGYMNLDAARAKLADHELDALLILSARHFYYATGHNSWFMNLYPEVGYGAAFIPTDPSSAPAALVSDVEEVPFRHTAKDFPMVMSYPVWIAYLDGPLAAPDVDVFMHLKTFSSGQPEVRAGQIDPENTIASLIKMIKSSGIVRGRIGIEEAIASGQMWHQLATALPAIQWVDATNLLEQLRAVKSPREVQLLRQGTQLAESGIADIIGHVRPGMTASEVAHRYRLAVFQAATGVGEVGSARITLRTGPYTLRPTSSDSYQLREGDMIFLDCGVEVSGYWADMGRCIVLGRASQAQRSIYDALRAGFSAATEKLQVGVAPAKVFDAGLSAVHAAGMKSYVRGNLGHGIGLARAPERPIISREEEMVLTDGHVVSVEFPYYIGGIGAFQIEDTFHLASNGNECFNKLSHDLVEVG
jgi:Xaa-Pro dipeptidase